MALDLQFDATTDGRPVKLVSLIDWHARACLNNLVERSVTAEVLIDDLDRLAMLRGSPAVLRWDNGLELACEAMAQWAAERVGLVLPLGEPWGNGYVCGYQAYAWAVGSDPSYAWPWCLRFDLTVPRRRRLHGPTEQPRPDGECRA